MRLLIAGWQGQLARCLVGSALRRGDVEACAAGRPALDLCELPTIQRNLTDVEPDVVINTAAYTAVDRAERESERAYALNRDGAAMLAEAAAARGVPIIHISSDYVFDGRRAGAYAEHHPTAPLSVYGASKLAGEEAVAKANPAHLIIRTAWVHSPLGKNFVTRMLAQAGEHAEIAVVADRRGSPTFAPHLAEVVLALAARIAADGCAPTAGVYHAAGRGSASWYEFAETIFAASKVHGGPQPALRAIRSPDYPTEAARPQNAALDMSHMEQTFGLTLPDWRLGARQCVAELMAQPD